MTKLRSALGFWALIFSIATLILFFLWPFNVIEPNPLYSTTLLAMIFISLSLSVVGLIKKEELKTLSTIALVLTVLLVLFLVYIFIPRPHHEPQTRCTDIEGICAADCSKLVGTYAQKLALSGKAGGCKEGEVCCISLLNPESQ
jgi:NADH:ubiquinone oxidoreductase subunit 6 (subunit J)